MACSCSLRLSCGGACSLSAAAGKPLRLLWSSIPHFGHEGSYGGPLVASSGAWKSSFRSLPIGKVHSIFPFGCNTKAIKFYTSQGNINYSVTPSSSLQAFRWLSSQCCKKTVRIFGSTLFS